MEQVAPAPLRRSGARIGAVVLGRVLAVVVLAAATAAALVVVPFPSPVEALAGGFAVSLLVWAAVSPRSELTLAVFFLYLGLLDGYLKLKTEATLATLGRDILLFAIALGVVVRGLITGRRPATPPLVGWVAAFVLLVLIQIANPNAESLGHSLDSLRQHLEFVPLFFLAYLVVRSKRRMKWFLFLLVGITAVNGIVSYVQTVIPTEQLASWGPGYEHRIEGSGPVADRVYFTESGEIAGARPFALGSDSGFGGILGMLAAPAVLALLMAARDLRTRLLVTLLGAGTVVAVLTSQARVAILGSLLAVAAFLVLGFASRRALSVAVTVFVAGLIGAATISLVTQEVGSDTFSRYGDISPDRAVVTAYHYRKETFSRLPDYIKAYPLGAGLGTAGPAAGALGSALGDELDTESQPNFMLVELGIAGLIVFFGLSIKLLALAITRLRRVADPELRVMLAGIAAPLFAIFVTGYVGATSSASPSSPYFWFAAGLLSYWLLRREPAGSGAS